MLSRDSSSSQFLHLVAVFLLLFMCHLDKTAELSDCYQPPHHYQAPQLACWPAALDGGSINASPQAGAALYSPYLATPAAAAAARVGTPAMPSMGGPTEVHQVLAAFAAATAAATASPGAMKDSRWLTLEVCRQYQRKMCSRDENECKFAHPPPHVDVQNGRVICCYDSIKGKCQRRDPPCKYFHPPQHLRELLLQNGRNNLILKNMQLQLLQQQLAQGAILPGLSAALAATAPTPSVASPGTPATHGIAGAPQCPNPTSPVSSTSIGPTGKLIYPPAPSLNLTPQGMATTYSLLGVGLSPYLTPTQLNSMAAAAATAAALKTVPPTVSLANGGGAGAGGLSAAHLAVMAAAATAAAAANASAVAPLAAPATPAKRPALADAKSGLPMFDYGQGLYALQTQAQAQLVGAKNLQPPQPPSQSSQQSPQKLSASTSVVTAAVNVGGVVAQENGVGGQEHGAPNEVDTQKAQVAAVGQFYPETH
ncbi:muscleblind protein [Echinococcus multilocularis]|uniref:Muscleblind protein n=1 Tax=Echinococcus multilocularis TaxID=6211 RepID=A0A087VX91_ECHMU|nr:muscleblind protein [Echinococcus multilocularis]